MALPSALSTSIEACGPTLGVATLFPVDCLFASVAVVAMFAPLHYAAHRDEQPKYLMPFPFLRLSPLAVL